MMVNLQKDFDKVLEIDIYLYIEEIESSNIVMERELFFFLMEIQVFFIFKCLINNNLFGKIFIYFERI